MQTDPDAPVPNPDAAAAQAAPLSTPLSTPPTASATSNQPSLRLLLTLLACVLAVAVAGYAWKGALPQVLQPTQASDTSDTSQPPISMEQIAAMTDKLAARLQAQPNDLQGWTMLARAYSVLGRPAEASSAYARALQLHPDDAALLADYADALASNNNGDLSGQPVQLLERALQMEPKQMKALYLLGTHAFNTKDYAKAIAQWQQVLALAVADSGITEEVQAAIAEARQLAGMDAAGKPPAIAPADSNRAASDAVDQATGKATEKATEKASKAVSGSVTLSAALRQQVQPDDTLFVFARKAPGTGMPLAIVRKQVRDLPLTFQLDDSMAMSAASPLSSASQVVISARISKSGNATPQPGDLFGQSAVVAPGAKGLQIEIQQVVQP
ncbi:MAG: tetratricopeptide repeat protein [Rhodoferax sp.]|nr:tetratricopeptide repeat protein [Rhodoferax sp.]